MKVDHVTIKILKEVALGETKIKRIAEKIDVPRTTIIARLQKMLERGVLSVSSAVSFYMLGLQPVVVINKTKAADINVPYLSFAVDFADYGEEYSLALFSFPVRHLDKYVKRVREKLGVVDILKTYDRVLWVPDERFARLEERGISVNWNALLEELETSDSKLELVEKPVLQVKLDQIDLFTLERLQENSFVKLKRVADRLGIHPNLLLYHYHKHVKPLLLGNIVRFNFWDYEEAPLELYMLKSADRESAERLLSAFRKLPNYHFSFLEVGGSRCLLALQMPSKDRLPFMRQVKRLKKHGLESVELLGIVDMETARYLTIPFRYFGKRGWLFAKSAKTS